MNVEVSTRVERPIDVAWPWLRDRMLRSPHGPLKGKVIERDGGAERSIDISALGLVGVNLGATADGDATTISLGLRLPLPWPFSRSARRKLEEALPEGLQKVKAEIEALPEPDPAHAAATAAGSEGGHDDG